MIFNVMQAPDTPEVLMDTKNDRIDDATWAARRATTKVVDQVARMAARAASRARRQARDAAVTAKDVGEKLLKLVD